MNRPYSLPLAGKVALVVLLLSLSAVWSVTYLTASRLHESIGRLLADQQFTAVSLIAADIEQEVAQRFRLLENVAARISPALLDQAPAVQLLLDAGPLAESVFTLGIVVISREGKLLADHPHRPERGTLDYGGFEYFQRVLTHTAPTVGKPGPSPGGGEPSIAIAVPLRAPDGAVIGVVAGYIGVSDPALFGFLENARLGRTGWLAITAPAHRLIVTSTDRSRILTDGAPPGANRMYDRFVAGYEGTGIALNSRGIETLTSARRIPSADWFVQGVLPTQEAFAPVKDLETFTYSAAVVVSILISALLWGASRQLLRPVADAARQIREMAEGTVPLSELQIRRHDEVGDLVLSFNSLVRQRKADESALTLASNVFEHTMDGVLVTDHRGRIVSVNPAFTRITGYTAVEAVGHSPRLMRSDEQAPEFYREMWAVLQREGRWEGEIWNRRKNGEMFLEWLSIGAVHDTDGAVLRYVGVFNDITALRRKDEHIRHLAFHDALTGLPNRALFHDRLRHAIEIASRQGERLGVMFIDLDRFKHINDSLGHDFGDELLQLVSRRLRDCLRSSDTVARVGGDEFVALLADTDKAPDHALVAQKIIDSLSQPILVRDQEIHIGASIGIAIYPEDGVDFITLMKHADSAMYAAKAGGRGTFRFFQARMTSKALEQLKLEMELRNAVANGELELHYQPKVLIGSEALCGLEALVRWRNPRLGMLQPASFIPLAEEIGLITQIGDWVLVEACRQLGRWQQGGELGELRVAVNISAKQLHSGGLVETILALCTRYRISPRNLEVELTESTIMAVPEDNAVVFSRLREIGVTVAMDDFGTGYSSLAYLRRLPLDVLKIDRSFVLGVDAHDSDARIIRTILALASALELKVVAEGVETREQADFLGSSGCQVGQGYLFGRPATAAQTTLLLRRVGPFAARA